MPTSGISAAGAGTSTAATAAARLGQTRTEPSGNAHAASGQRGQGGSGASSAKASAPAAASAGADDDLLIHGTNAQAADKAAEIAHLPALSPLLDALATLILPQPMGGHVILQALPTTKRAGSKPFLIEGKNLSNQQWEPVHADQRYGQLQAGVQLANRLGALNDIEFSEFAQKVQALADGLGARLELPDMAEEVARAREIDAFAAAQDIQLSFMLRPRRAAWSTGYIDQQATQHGFVPASLPGRMQLPQPAPHVGGMLLLSFDPQAAQAEDLDRTAVYEINISLDVPQVPPQLAPFARMCHLLQALAQDMDALLCDASGDLVDPALLTQIGQDLENYYVTLSSRDFAAGSMLARRLFS